MIKKIIVFLPVMVLLFAFNSKLTKASPSCAEKYLTLVNPIRGRERWFDKSLTPLTDQYQEIKKYDYPATWLIQYDALQDKDIVSEINKFDNGQEIGVFLEVFPQFA